VDPKHHIHGYDSSNVKKKEADQPESSDSEEIEINLSNMKSPIFPKRRVSKCSLRLPTVTPGNKKEKVLKLARKLMSNYGDTPASNLLSPASVNPSNLSSLNNS